MSRLYLLRHAKAVGSAPGMKDFDRPLSNKGAEAARKIGSAMMATGFIPDLALCSTAKRTRETLDNLRLTLTTPFSVVESSALYTADANGYLDAIHSASNASSLLLIGHNPSMGDLALALAANGQPALLDRLTHGFPTAGLAVIDFDGPLTLAEAGAGTLRAFITPADI
ncbi:histidine phosphatase [Phyllobacterium phragmitis]|uniref:Histidine phosphatase n=1 Tax=Phyllobacterium phragmitis TaxID=2670329 RepID=A0A2S9IM21_9HYPH|nr:histidine phosphatase family protein [Phyllobacterium phragmitis]PRD41565.1 histidine phosphatase [Phyllobacterium phragmitis]